MAYGGGWLEPAEDMAKQLLADRDIAVPAGQDAVSTLYKLDPRTLRTEAEHIEADSRRPIELIWAKVALGQCKDFGGRCTSERCVGEKISRREWPVYGGGERTRPPPRLDSGASNDLYDSVTGTEGNLEWVAHPTLKEFGHQIGRQYTTFNTAQAYPELVITLRRGADAIVAQFMAECDTDQDTARRCLEDAGWELQAAVESHRPPEPPADVASSSQPALSEGVPPEPAAAGPPEGECWKQKPTLRTWPACFARIEGRGLSFYDHPPSIKPLEDQQPRGSSIADVTGCTVDKGWESWLLSDDKPKLMLKRDNLQGGGVSSVCFASERLRDQFYEALHNLSLGRAWDQAPSLATCRRCGKRMPYAEVEAHECAPAPEPGPGAEPEPEPEPE